eukprot:TRINITY_DN11270_c0_g1_i12.p1 TRINITY_DN11270_c0_g1~~TRINITY_DN11270_c0_g1_i12.p1  ORF type:complete len:210 (+),score=32.71 TRINITY_DN11270_c0_g1_i12:49-678(+)
MVSIWMEMKTITCINSLWLISFALLIGSVSGGDYVQQSITQEIGEGNYTYYRIEEPGRVHLKLVSLEGDADLYVATETSNPTYELEEHIYSSVTCGVDTLEIEQSQPRPLFVGVYGYPQFAITKYELTVTIFKHSGRKKTGGVDFEGEDYYDPEPFNPDDFQYNPSNSYTEDPNMSEPGGDYGTSARSTLNLVWPVISSIIEIAIEVLL